MSHVPPPDNPDSSVNHRQGKEPSVWVQEITTIVQMVVLCIAVFWVVNTFALEGFRVQGHSMEPTLSDGDQILVLKLPVTLHHVFPQWFTQPVKQSDIVVLDSKEEEHKRYVKRVIACGPPSHPTQVWAAGQHPTTDDPVSVLYQGGKIYVNNHLLEEPYRTIPDTSAGEQRTTAILLNGQYYVMGDNRPASKDSRIFGPIHENQIIGKAWFRFWPLSRAGFL